MADIVGALDAMNDIEIASDAPLTEALHTKYGANVNELIKAYMPVGSIIHSLLTEAEFQAEIGSTSWVIAQGQNVSGSKYHTLTGQTNVPDCRGRFLRGKNNGVSQGDGDGERALGSYQNSRIADHKHSGVAHSHAVPIKTVTSGPAGGGGPFYTYALTPDSPAGTSGNLFTSTTGNIESLVDTGSPAFTRTNNQTDQDTAPKNICVNIFVRIN